jgi:hypothetical protein
MKFRDGSTHFSVALFTGGTGRFPVHTHSCATCTVEWEFVDNMTACSTERPPESPRASPQISRSIHVRLAHV